MDEYNEYEAPLIQQLGGANDLVAAGAAIALPIPVVVAVVGPAVVVI